jgi:hypothetical protein
VFDGSKQILYVYLCTTVWFGLFVQTLSHTCSTGHFT